jgi:uncharacterized C2H2 Zn-finger protein
MREGDLVELAVVISRAWAAGCGRPVQDADMVRFTIFDALREIHDRDGAVETAPPSAAAVQLNRGASVKLFYCPNCESIFRDVSALQRHRRFCPGQKWRAGWPRNPEATV